MDGNMFTPQALEAWYRLMAEAMRGTAEAQEALKKFAEMSATPEGMNRWMAQFMPGATPPTGFQPEQFEEQLESWWRMMGAVPRSRYLELLERCDSLERKLKKAEETIAGLREKLGAQGRQQEDAQQAFGLWGAMVEESLKAQAEWMKAWRDAATEPDASPPTEDAGDQPDNP
ncbi:MAG: hypothetical protein D6768_07190 [Chloroflexi bacterium]|nr:MAG: hypothetical protein D6768_07190 [Chloroflexota bacterium]